jgi:hypothetical protein
MKKLLFVLALTLAINFLAAAGGVGWLFQTGRLDRQKVRAIREMVFPSAPTAKPATQPSDPSTQPVTLRLEELLAKHAGKPAGEQLEHIRESFDSQMAQLERSQRNLLDLQRLVEQGQKKLAEDRLALAAKEKALEDREKSAERLAVDKGFQDSLALYQSMPAKQVKQLFLGMEDQTIVQFLQAMEGRAASKITKEFKTPEEVERLKKIMERMRQSANPQATQPTASAAE